MANALKRDLQKGEKVYVMGCAEPWYVDGGFGAASFTSGRALFLSREKNGSEVIRFDGYDIDVEQTMRLCAKENGWESEAAQA